MKYCFKCGIKKDLEEFYKHPQMPDGRVNKCKECNKKDVRENLHKKKKYYAKYDRKRIRYNFNYIFLHRFSGILARVEGRVGKRTKPYKVTGTRMFTKEQFLRWCYLPKNLNKFQRLHEEWVKSKFQRKLCPSIDRINEDKGYTLNNIQWLTCGDNHKKYVNFRWKK